MRSGKSVTSEGIQDAIQYQSLTMMFFDALYPLLKWKWYLFKYIPLYIMLQQQLTLFLIAWSKCLIQMEHMTYVVLFYCDDSFIITGCTCIAKGRWNRWIFKKFINTRVSKFTFLYLEFSRKWIGFKTVFDKRKAIISFNSSPW